MRHELAGRLSVGRREIHKSIFILSAARHDVDGQNMCVEKREKFLLINEMFGRKNKRKL